MSVLSDVRSDVTGFGLVLKAEMVRAFIYTKRYPVATGVGLFLQLIMIMAFVPVGVKLASFGADNPGLSKVYSAESVMAFLMWGYAASAIGLFTNSIRSSAETGVLEQICTSPHGLVTNFLAKAAVVTFFQTLSLGILCGLIYSFFDLPELNINLMSDALVFFLTLGGLYGLGFALGGLTLLVKRVGQISILLRLAFLPVALMNLGNLPGANAQTQPVVEGFLRCMPMFHGLDMLKKMILHNASLGDFVASGNPGLPWLVANTAIWLILGLLAFRLMENVCRNHGGLGTY